MVRPGDRLPSVSLQDLAGAAVPLSRFRGRLSLALFLAGDGTARGALRALMSLEPELQQWGAETVLVTTAPAAEAAALARGLAFEGRTLLDRGGTLHRRLSALRPDDQPRPALLLVDRGGELRFRLDAAANGETLSEESRDDAIGWARYLGIQEPECGTCVPAWPEELMEGLGEGFETTHSLR